jgi:hypothetical protein
MVGNPPTEDAGDRDLTVSAPKRSAARIPGVAAGLREMGVRRSGVTLLRMNQVNGFDRLWCAWPEQGPDRQRTVGAPRFAPAIRRRNLFQVALHRTGGGRSLASGV